MNSKLVLNCKTMTEKERIPSQFISFDNKRYEIDKLPNEIKDMIQGLKVADTQVKMQEDDLKLLIIARQTMTENLRYKLDKLEYDNQK